MCRQCGEFVGRTDKREAAAFRQLRGDTLAEFRMRIEPGTHRRAPDGQFMKGKLRSGDNRFGKLQLRDVSRKLLAERQRVCACLLYTSRCV